MIENLNNATYVYSLAQLRGIKYQEIVEITDKFQTVDALINSKSDLIFQRLGNQLGEKLYDSMKYYDFPKLLLHSKDVLERQIRDSVLFTTIIDNNYPKLLKKISNPPLLLYYKGNISILNERDSIAVIGTRNASSTGLNIASIIAREFAERGYIIVSGLAKGIDTAAHMGALETNGYTAAVLGAPLDKIYPAENRPLVERILSHDGVVLSELGNGQVSFRGNFVQRDRIQSGLSIGIIPVQTDVEGGTMHTVNFALQQKRLVFCPRPPEREMHLNQYAGILSLIQEAKAKGFKYDEIQQVVDELRNYKEILSNKLPQANKSILSREFRVIQPSFPLMVDYINQGVDYIAKAKVDKIAECFHESGYDSDPIMFEKIINQLRNIFFSDKDSK
jgi:DNA processing protein